MNPVSPDGMQRFPTCEGTAPWLIGYVTSDGRPLAVADIATIRATIRNITFGTTVLDEESLDIDSVFFDEAQQALDAEGRTVTYNFAFPTDSEYFIRSDFDDDCQYLVEVHIDPALGETFQGRWLVTAKKSIVYSPAT